MMNLSETFIAFRMNIVSFFATRTQKHLNRIWKHSPTTTRERIALFIISHCSHPAGHKTIKIKMTQMAEELNDNRLNVSTALNAMQADGLITLSRGVITVPKLEKIIQFTE